MQMSKSIRLSDEAYERLKAHKEEEETFTDVVLRLAGEHSPSNWPVFSMTRKLLV